jgi:chromate reductase, NAD(P)H dehydrogenase (quinone)
MYPINGPEVMIANASERFDRNGDLVDETSRQLIGQLIDNLVGWTRRLQSAA